jgi:hypothetical protein
MVRSGVVDGSTVVELLDAEVREAFSSDPVLRTVYMTD